MSTIFIEDIIFVPDTCKVESIVVSQVIWFALQRNWRKSPSSAAFIQTQRLLAMCRQDIGRSCFYSVFPSSWNQPTRQPWHFEPKEDKINIFAMSRVELKTYPVQIIRFIQLSQRILPTWKNVFWIGNRYIYNTNNQPVSYNVLQARQSQWQWRVNTTTTNSLTIHVSRCKFKMRVACSAYLVSFGLHNRFQ
jgi:hypothetical protein